MISYVIIEILHQIPLTIPNENFDIHTFFFIILHKSRYPFGFDVTRPRFVEIRVFPLFFKPAFVDFFTANNVLVHCSRTHKLHFSVTFSLKMGLIVLFTHLKIISQIILLQCFQFQFLVLVKISCI